MSKEIPNTPYIPQTGQTGAGTPATTGTPVQTPPVDEYENAFDAGQTGETPDGAGMDTFVPSADASVEDLSAQMAEVQANNAALEESEATTQGAIERYDSFIAGQEQHISDLTEANEAIKVANKELSDALTGLYSDLSGIEDTIDDLESQISAASGFVGGLVNAFNNIFGNGVDVGALKEQLAAAKASKLQIEDQIRAKEQELIDNGIEFTKNSGRIRNTERLKENNEKNKAEQEAALAEIQRMYQEGKLTEQQLSSMVEAAYAAEAEQNNTNEKPSAEQVQGTTAVVADIMQNGQLNTGSAEAIEKGVEAQNTITGEFTSGAFTEAYLQAGFSPEEIGQRLEIMQAIASYAELGLAFDPRMLQAGSVAQLDMIVENAIVQDVMRTTGSKFVGRSGNITTKKDMEEYSEAVDDFISTYSALNSYYQSNNINDLEVDGFLSLSSDMLSKINQGYVYSTSDLQEATNNAGNMMTTLQTKVSSGDLSGESANVAFEESRNRTENAIDNAEGQLAGQEDDGTIGDFRTEFLNLTNRYNDSDTDSARQANIQAMENLYQRALNAENGVDKDPFRNSLNIAA